MLQNRVLVLAVLAYCSVPALITRADDDPIPPPFEPGPGFEGILPAPTVPSNYFRDQHTIPYGLQSVANTPVLHLGQSFRPTLSSVDWVAFLFQNSTQPNDPAAPGPGYLQVDLYSNINTSNGVLSGLLGSTDVVSIDSNITSWLVFHFPASVAVTPATRYYFHVRQTDGYQSWVGIRHQSTYSNGNAFGYFYDTVFNNPPQNLNWGGYDLHFAEGIIAPRQQGDFDYDGDVDGIDMLEWQRSFGSTVWRNTGADGDGDGDVDSDDLTVWQAHYGTHALPAPATAITPEPTTWALLVIAVTGSTGGRRIRKVVDNLR